MVFFETVVACRNCQLRKLESKVYIFLLFMILETISAHCFTLHSSKVSRVIVTVVIDRVQDYERALRKGLDNASVANLHRLSSEIAIWYELGIDDLLLSLERIIDGHLNYPFVTDFASWEGELEHKAAISVRWLRLVAELSMSGQSSRIMTGLRGHSNIGNKRRALVALWLSPLPEKQRQVCIFASLSMYDCF